MNIHLGEVNSASSHRQISCEIVHYVKLGMKFDVKLGVKLQREIMLPQAGEGFSRSVFTGVLTAVWSRLFSQRVRPWQFQKGAVILRIVFSLVVSFFASPKKITFLMRRTL